MVCRVGKRISCYSLAICCMDTYQLKDFIGVWWSCAGNGMECLYNEILKMIGEHDVADNKKARLITRGSFPWTVRTCGHKIMQRLQV